MLLSAMLYYPTAALYNIYVQAMAATIGLRNVAYYVTAGECSTIHFI